MDTSLILSIVLSKVIPFSLRYRDIEEQPIQNLFVNVGDELLWEVSREYYNNDLKSGKIHKGELTLTEYKIKNKLFLGNDQLIQMGFAFVLLLSNNSNFIELKEYNVAKNKTVRHIIIREGLKNLINNIAIIDSEELPMIIKPLP